MAWLLDTNVLVNAKRDYYGFEFCPGFWEWLDVAWAAGQVAPCICARRRAHGRHARAPGEHAQAHPIPNAAVALHVSYVSPWRMLRKERPMFVLGEVSR